MYITIISGTKFFRAKIFKEVSLVKGHGIEH